MKNIWNIPFLMIALHLLASAGAMAQDTVFLDKPHSRPFLTVFKPTGKTTGSAVIICSGGSYRWTLDGAEGIPAANLLARNGISAFVLDYRLPAGHDSIPLMDAQAAIAWVRRHAKQFVIKENEVGIMGFSAGGHLVSSIGTHFRERYGNTPEGANLRPDFMVLVYPVISMTDGLTHADSKNNFLGNAATAAQVRDFSNELQVTDDTSPAYIVAAMDDGIVNVSNSLYFSAALLQHRVKSDLFLYASGGHAFGIKNQAAKVQWTDDCIRWIKTGAWRENKNSNK